MGLCAPWATIDDLCAPCSSVDVIDEAAFDVALLKASEALYEFTGRKWSGVCQDVFRPTTCGCRRPVPSWECCGGSLVLPGFPVTAVDHVRIDGVDLDPSSYRIDDRSRLVFVRATAADPLPSWPGGQDLSLPTTQPRTWEIAYRFGVAPPAGGVGAAAELGCELALACQPRDGDCFKLCRLPRRVTNITRQGVSMAILDPLDLFDNGKTGLESVDFWVSTVRYGDKYRPAAVYDSNKWRRRAVRSS